MCFPFPGSLKDTKEKVANPFCRRQGHINSVIIKVTTAGLQGSNITTRKKKKKLKKKLLLTTVWTNNYHCQLDEMGCDGSEV
jgi:hypothetical protein